MEAEPQFFATPGRADGELIIEVRGELDMATCARLDAAIEPHAGTSRRIILDLSGVQFLDSSALSAMVRARENVVGEGGVLFVRNPSPIVARLLAIADLLDLLEADD